MYYKIEKEHTTQTRKYEGKCVHSSTIHPLPPQLYFNVNVTCSSFVVVKMNFSSGHRLFAFKDIMSIVTNLMKRKLIGTHGKLIRDVFLERSLVMVWPLVIEPLWQHSLSEAESALPSFSENGCLELPHVISGSFCPHSLTFSSLLSCLLFSFSHPFLTETLPSSILTSTPHNF